MPAKKFCRFTAVVQKAYTRDGMKHITAMASDNLIDREEEAFTEKALEDMVSYAKMRNPRKPEEGYVGLRDSHISSFNIGYVTDGWIEKHEDVSQFWVDIALKEEYPQAVELYNDVHSGTVDRKLSVGGYVPDFGNNFEYEPRTVVTQDGGEVTVFAGVMKAYHLNHIACTPFNKPANGRVFFEKSNSGFVGEIFKSLVDEEYQVSRRKALDKDKEKNKDIVKELGKDMSALSEEIKEHKSVFKSLADKVDRFLSRNKEDEMANKEAIDYVEKIKSLGLSTEELASTGISFVATEGKKDEASEGITEEVVKSLITESINGFDEKFAEGKVAVGALSEKVEGLVILDEEKVKSLLKEAIGELKISELSSKVEESVEKIKSLETASGISQNTVDTKGDESNKDDDKDKNKDFSGDGEDDIDAGDNVWDI